MPRWLWVATGTRPRDSLDLRLAVVGFGQALTGARGDQLLCARAGGHALRLDAGQRPRAGGEGDRGAEQRVDLLRRLAADGCRHRLRVAGGERDLRAHPALPVADALGDPGGEVLGLQGLGENGLVDRLVDDLLEAGHVGAGLLRAAVYVGLELGEEELRPAAVGAFGLDPDDLLDAADADAREADLGARAARLHVGTGRGASRVAEQCGRMVHRFANRKATEVNSQAASVAYSLGALGRGMHPRSRWR